jgi:IS30 family transposase
MRIQKSRARKTLKIPTTYFADPFASWQRWSNENYNGLLRQYIPKNRHLSAFTDEGLKMMKID